MKRLLAFMLGLFLLFPVCSIGEDMDLSEMTSEQLADLQSRIQAELSNRPDDYDGIVLQALSALEDGWREEYAKYGAPGIAYHIDIRGVRVIRIREELGEKEAAIFGDIKYLVEFLLYDDYFSNGSAIGSGHNVGYLDLSGVNNVVTVDRGGNMALVKNNPLRVYTSRTYENDYSMIIEEVIDFHEQYNQVIEFP